MFQVEGIMTIGALAHSVAKEHEAGANPDFLTLIECRGKIAEALEVAPMSLELSMGMSNDFEEAIRGAPVLQFVHPALRVYCLHHS